jgi:hypothetical protein
MVPNNFCSISKKKCSPARDSLCPLYSRVTRRGRLDAKLKGSSPVLETWGRVWSSPVPPLMETGPNQIQLSPRTTCVCRVNI